MGHRGCVHVLMEAGSNVEQPDGGGWRPLWWAAALGHGECLRALLEAGARVADVEGARCEALELAVGGGHEGVAVALFQRLPRSFHVSETSARHATIGAVKAG